MTNDTRPPVAPKEGHYAMLRNGVVVGPLFKEWPGDTCMAFKFGYQQLDWFVASGKGEGLLDDFDIIATISPEAMALAIHPDMDGAVKAIESLVKLADAACDYADQHCRAFPIATAPKEGVFLAWDNFGGEWEILAAGNEGFYHPERFTHWGPLPPPPSNPPLPAVFTELGQALEKIKGAG